jgi:hypothetical protein
MAYHVIFVPITALNLLARHCFNGPAKESLQLALIEPGKPWQNGTNESFNRKFRDECLPWNGSEIAWKRKL